MARDHKGDTLHVSDNTGMDRISALGPRRSVVLGMVARDRPSLCGPHPLRPYFGMLRQPGDSPGPPDPACGGVLSVIGDATLRENDWPAPDHVRPGASARFDGRSGRVDFVNRAYSGESPTIAGHLDLEVDGDGRVTGQGRQCWVSATLAGAQLRVRASAEVTIGAGLGHLIGTDREAADRHLYPVGFGAGLRIDGQHRTIGFEGDVRLRSGAAPDHRFGPAADPSDGPRPPARAPGPGQRRGARSRRRSGP